VAVQNTPAAEVDITAVLVRSLLAEQQPDLAHLPLTLVANGWDNAIFRLGDHLLVRLPRRQLGADLVENEQRWLPRLVDRLPLSIPAPVRSGTPTSSYPWSWSVCPWFDGDVAADVAVDDPSAEAERLGTFVHALHAIDPDGAPANPFRGQPIADLVPRIETNIDRLGDLIDAATVRSRLGHLTSAGEWSGAPVLLHADLHTANVLIADGRITAVLDFGDITAGDPAVDLAIGWMLFDDVDRSTFRDAASGSRPIDDATWCRGEIWALHFALLYLLHSGDEERFARMGSELLAAVTASA